MQKVPKQLAYRLVNLCCKIENLYVSLSELDILWFPYNILSKFCCSHSDCGDRQVTKPSHTGDIKHQQ